MKGITNYMKDALKGLPQSEELLDKLISLILRINLSMEILNESGIGSPMFKLVETTKYVDQIRNRLLAEQIRNRWFKYYTKYQTLLQEWREESKKIGQDRGGKEKKKMMHGEDPRKKVRRDSSDSQKGGKKKMEKKKVVRFQRDEQLIQFKVFRREDEPNAKGLNQVEFEEFQRKYAEELKKITHSAYEIKHRESQMEGRSHKQIMDNVQQMNEQITFARPKRLIPKEDEFENMSFEIQAQQKRIESKMSAFYHRDIGIPAEPGYIEIENTSKEILPIRTIILNQAKREDLMSIINTICDKFYKDAQEKQQNQNRKPIKGILKKPPEEMQKQKEILEKAKSDLEPMMLELTQMLNNRSIYTQDQILTLLYQILVKMKALGQEKYIQNVKIMVQNILNSAQQQQHDQQIQQQREQQQIMLKNRMSVTNGGGFNPLLNARLKAYKTKPCHNYHSAKGCTRGEACNFIHDVKFQGQPHPEYLMTNLNMPIPDLLNKNLFSQQIQNQTGPTPYFLQQLHPSRAFQPTNPQMMMNPPQYMKKYESL